MNTTIQIRIDKTTKTKAQKAFKVMGLDMSAGVKMFLTDVARNQCMPFVPSTKRTRAIRRMMDKEVAWAIKHGKRYTSAKEMHADILKET
jgi:addiction module RelB/DinJ family antitoxin